VLSRANFSSKAFCNLFLSSSCSRRSCCFRSNASDSLWSRATSSSSVNARTLNDALLSSSRRLLNGNDVLFPLSAIVSLHLGVVFFVLKVVLVDDDDDFCQKPSPWEDNDDCNLLIIFYYCIYSARAGITCARGDSSFFLFITCFFVFVCMYMYLCTPGARVQKRPRDDNNTRSRVLRKRRGWLEEEIGKMTHARLHYCVDCRYWITARFIGREGREEKSFLHFFHSFFI